MDKIILTTKLDPGLTEPIMNRMLNAYANTPQLSYRSRSEMEQFYQKGEVVFAQVDTEVVGWLIRSSLSASLFEISGIYVEEKFRSKGVFKAMMNLALNSKSQYLVVTFLPNLAKYLIEQYGFSQSSLFQVIKQTRGKFVFRFFSFRRLVSVLQHFRLGPPIYLLKIESV